MSVIQIWILIEVEAVRQELDFLLLASPSGCLDFNIRNDPRPVRRAVLVKDERRQAPPRLRRRPAVR